MSQNAGKPGSCSMSSSAYPCKPLKAGSVVVI